MAFTVKGVNDTTYQTPDNDSKPLIEAPPVLRYPEAMGFTGEGKPCARVGKPWAIVGRNSMNSTGFAWWSARAGTTLVPVEVNVTLWDPRSVAWGTYTAYLDWPPKYNIGSPADVPKLTDVRFMFSAITAV